MEVKINNECICHQVHNSCFLTLEDNLPIHQWIFINNHDHKQQLTISQCALCQSLHLNASHELFELLTDAQWHLLCDNVAQATSFTALPSAVLSSLNNCDFHYYAFETSGRLRKQSKPSLLAFLKRLFHKQ